MQEKSLISYLEKLILYEFNNKNLVIVGIDGPTASGKTILANNLAQSIEKNSSEDLSLEFYRLDWQLKNRQERVNDLEIIKKSSSDFFLEGEMHMLLGNFKSFLEKITLKHNIFETSKKQEDEIFKIDNLYSRENNGQRTGEYIYKIKDKLLIICEGHYTSRSEYSALIDINICLLSECEELLKRKINRVSGYRGSKEAESYFNLIDIPSFNYHLRRFKRNIDVVIDNTDFNNPIIKENKFINKWLIKTNSTKNFSIKEINQLTNYENIFYKIFSVSELGLGLNLKIFEIIINLHHDFHLITANRILRQAEYPEYDISLESLKNINAAEKKIRSINPNLQLEVSTKNCFNLSPRERKLPVTIGINLINKQNDIEKNYCYRFHFSVYQNRCELLISWIGGTFLLEKKDNLSNITDNTNKNNFWKILDFKETNSIKNSTNDLRIYIPTDYCIPEFLKNHKYQIVYTLKEHELTPFYTLLNKILNEENSVLVHRFSEFVELDFYRSILQNSGCSTIGIHNYLIAVKTSDSNFSKKCRSWQNNWLLNSLFLKDAVHKYDKKINEELVSAKDEIEKITNNFTLIDTFLVKKANSSPKTNSLIEDLKKMLKSDNRTVRKRSFNYICQEFPFMSLKTNDFLKCFDIDQKVKNSQTINLEEIKYLYPSIFAELYLWQEIRGDKSAILGSNIYDLKGELSLDSLGILAAASETQVPVVLQSSFNALGQKEYKDQIPYEGYLKAPNGSSDLINYGIKCAIYNKFIQNKKNTLYGIGLDHVDSRNDIPTGRAKNFLNKSLDNKNLTHLVLDGSSLFSAKDRSHESLSKSYFEVANYESDLLNTDKENFLIDKEYCIGELSYIGDDEIPMIPKDNEITLFIRNLRKLFMKKNLEHELCRPSLFIGNVGTTHHSKDKNNINSSITGSWVKRAKNYGFISAVLHGTTNSSKNVLSESTSGCHKVNVAGDFLKIFQESLPNHIDSSLKKFTSKSKYLMPIISEQKVNFNNKELEIISTSIKKKAKRIFNTINSPILSGKDQRFFHRFSYFLNDKLINLILKEFYEKISNKSETSKFYKNYLKGSFSASMIEVSFEEGFTEYADKLIKNGIKYFHIDHGDGEFISRSFSGIDKVRYLSSINKELSIHAHLMVQNPMKRNNSNQSIIDQYIEAGISRIGFHSRSFNSENDLSEAIKYVKKFKRIPGIIIETDFNELEEAWKLITKYSLNWVIMMGVPIGYGGQLFVPHTLEKIKFLREKSIKHNYDLDIEADGGLNFENLNNCYLNGANIFAGWSIIKSKNSEEIVNKFKKVEEILGE